MNKLQYLLICLLLISLQAQAETDMLGRLFTTPAQRAMLEGLRNAKPKAPEHIVKQYEPVTVTGVQPEFIEEEELQEIPTLAGPISLKGIVSRKKGNHTAWINENNTYEGGMIDEDVSIRTRDIKTDSVKVELPDRVTNITLKVGETYAPEITSETDEIEN